MITPKKLARQLGLNYEALSYEQQQSLRDECSKQVWLDTIHEQGFVRAAWRGVPIMPKDRIK